MKILVLPTYLIMRISVLFLPKDNLFRMSPITLKNWAIYSTPLLVIFSVGTWVVMIYYIYVLISFCVYEQ